MELIADRFVRERATWFDVATGRPVRLIAGPAGRVDRQLAWADRCAMLARLRHPMVRPLIDYGAAGAAATFEAFAIGPALWAGRGAAERLRRHAARFLAAHGLAATPAGPAPLVRSVRTRTRPARAGRSVGIVLQPRRALDAAVDVLDGSAGGGVVSVAVAGPAGSGLGTLRLDIARAARIRGYVPVAVESTSRWPQLARALAGRHVCVLAGGGGWDQQAAAALLARLGVESARRHVCFRFHRDRAPADALPLDPMGVSTMIGMVYLDPVEGPSQDELVDAARASAGRPGRFLEAIGAVWWNTPSHAIAVHESPAPYVAAGTPAAVPKPTGESRVRRIGGCVAGARRRAAVLCGRGRHAAAVRLLQRAARVLEGRGEPDGAAACLVDLAWIARDRGDTRAAVGSCERARTLALDAALQIRAALAIGVCWTDEERHVEAEAALRSALAAAGALGDESLHGRCAVALARVLFWQARLDESLEAMAPIALGREDSECAAESCALRARIHARRAELGDALRWARRALDLASRSSAPRLGAAAHRAMALALAHAGDLAGVRAHVAAGLNAAGDGHLPLLALRLRAVLRDALAAARDAGAPAHAGSLGRAARRRGVPPLLRTQLSIADAGSTQTPFAASPPPSPLEDLLDVALKATDDRAAVEQVAAAMCGALGAASVAVLARSSEVRVLAAAGRPWRERFAAGSQALATGLPVPPDPFRQPPEAAEAVRCAGEIIGAVAARWLAGAAPDAARCAAVLRAGARAIAPQLRALADALPAQPPAAAWGDLLGESKPAAALREAVLRAARAPFPVLIEGESGSGKELVARAVHRLSARRDRRFCAINCAAISDDLVEAELFGHVRGAFTGAAGERAGLFEEADGGTLFLDEIGELTGRAQAKLLRVLQDGEVRRVGENLPRKVDVRIVAATNRRLEQEVAAGRFRADLRFRLDVVRITVPPLRDRVADIPLLAAHFWRQAAARMGTAATLSPDALAALSRYDWPGNVRELQNAIAWIAVHAPRRGRVGAALLPVQLASSAPLSTGSFEAAREEFERRFVRAALAQAGGRRGKAAQALGVSRQGLAKMLRRLGIA